MNRGEARVRGFELVQLVQTGDPTAADELAQLGRLARASGWDEVVRVTVYGAAVTAWFEQQDALPAALDALVELAQSDGDACFEAIGLAMRAAFVHDGTRPASSLTDAALAEAIVLLESLPATPGQALELITAHTACGIALDYRSLWELGDQQYEAALRLADEAEPGIGDTLLAAVMFNRAEALCAWASALHQLEDRTALSPVRRAWSAVLRDSGRFAMPEAWQREFVALQHLVAALLGEEISEPLPEAGDGDESARKTTALVTLARAVAAAGQAGPEAPALAAAAVEAVRPGVFPTLHDLALHLAAQTESGHAPFSHRYARRQLEHRWDERLAQLESLRARLAEQRLRRELARVSVEATQDELTGLGNRRALAAFVELLAAQHIAEVAIVLVDVDHFKQINDRYGHAIGDRVLAAVASILRGNVRPEDLAVRLGGDEFLLALSGVDLDTATTRSEALLSAIVSAGWHELAPGLQVAVSLGVASGPRQDVERVRVRADEALYASKSGGGGQLSVAAKVVA